MSSFINAVRSSFTVRELITPRAQLETADAAEDAFRKMEDGGFEVIPRSDPRVINSYWRRGCLHEVEIKREQLVGLGLPIVATIQLLADQDFLFVVGGRGVDGYIHRSDLNRPAVKIVLFAYFEHAERVMFETIKTSLTIDSLNGKIGEKRHGEVTKAHERMVARGTDHSWSGLLYFREVLELAHDEQKRPLPACRWHLNTFRNRVAHGDQELIMRPNDVTKLKLVVDELELIIRAFDAPRRTSAASSRR